MLISRFSGQGLQQAQHAQQGPRERMKDQTVRANQNPPRHPTVAGMSFQQIFLFCVSDNGLHESIVDVDAEQPTQDRV
jgi:hypothetical protein